MSASRDDLDSALRVAYVEIDTLRAQLADYKAGQERYEDLCDSNRAEIRELRAKLAEAHALLRGVGEYGAITPKWRERRDTLLSASAEPTAPIERDERSALRAFVGAAYPVAQQINPRGYNWSEAYLDEALAMARAALERKP